MSFATLNLTVKTTVSSTIEKTEMMVVASEVTGHRALYANANSARTGSSVKIVSSLNSEMTSTSAGSVRTEKSANSIVTAKSAEESAVKVHPQ